MKWTSTKEKLPSESGAYVISLSTKDKHGQEFIRKYVAHYNINEHKWFRYDPFTIGNEVKDEIKEKITGWIENASIFLQ